MRRFLGTVPSNILPLNRTTSLGLQGGGDCDAQLDTSMVIVLAALLCALVGAIGLHSAIQCALRCGRRGTSEAEEEAAARLAATGLKKNALRRIPVAEFGHGVEFPMTECCICLAEFADGEKVRVMPKCNHTFHVRCIDTWLAAHSSCPTCRHSLLASLAEEGGGY